MIIVNTSWHSWFESRLWLWRRKMTRADRTRGITKDNSTNFRHQSLFTGLVKYQRNWNYSLLHVSKHQSSCITWGSACGGHKLQIWMLLQRSSKFWQTQVRPCSTEDLRLVWSVVRISRGVPELWLNMSLMHHADLDSWLWPRRSNLFILKFE